MRRLSRKSWLTEAWAFLAVAAIAFVGGLLIGDLGSSPKTETVHASATEAEEASTQEAGGEPAASGGAQVFADNGCGSCHTLAAAGSTGEVGPNLEESLAPDDDTAGIEEMIVKPNLEVIEGYSENVMPQDYGESLSPAELHDLSEFLVESTPAKP
jgi:mono/diheme cytochrome c family protein